MRGAWDRFWAWYEKYYLVNVGVSAVLFLLQVAHLYWLATDVIAERLVGVSYFPASETVIVLLLFVDYIEIPTLISVSLIYVNELRKGFNWRSATLLFLLNTQWLHIFWITDELAVSIFTGEQSTVLPVWLAWVAILIDYLEVPVMIDTVWRFVTAPRPKSWTEA